MYTVRRPLGATGPLLTYVGPLLILLGLLLNDTLGWHAANIALARGNSTLLPARRVCGSRSMALPASNPRR